MDGTIFSSCGGRLSLSSTETFPRCFAINHHSIKHIFLSCFTCFMEGSDVKDRPSFSSLGFRRVASGASLVEGSGSATVEGMDVTYAKSSALPFQVHHWVRRTKMYQGLEAFSVMLCSGPLHILTSLFSLFA